jgi:hypothetical protein
MLPISLAPALALMYFYIRTFRSMCAVPNILLLLLLLVMPRLCELYPCICLTTEVMHGKTSIRVVEKCPDFQVAVVQYTE